MVVILLINYHNHIIHQLLQYIIHVAINYCYHHTTPTNGIMMIMTMVLLISRSLTIVLYNHNYWINITTVIF